MKAVEDAKRARSKFWWWYAATTIGIGLLGWYRIRHEFTGTELPELKPWQALTWVVATVVVYPLPVVLFIRWLARRARRRGTPREGRKPPICSQLYCRHASRGRLREPRNLV